MSNTESLNGECNSEMSFSGRPKIVYIPLEIRVLISIIFIIYNFEYMRGFVDKVSIKLFELINMIYMDSLLKVICILVDYLILPLLILTVIINSELKQPRMARKLQQNIFISLSCAVYGFFNLTCA